MTRGTLTRNPRPARTISIRCHIPGGQSPRVRASLHQKCFLRSEPLGFCRYRHSGMVDVNQAPSTLFPTIELCLPTVGREGRAIVSELGSEIPIELGPGCVPVKDRKSTRLNSSH